MKNLLLDDIEYKVEKSRFGVWRRYLYPTGASFAEFRSRGRLFGLPIVHYTRGICPETGRRVVAKGVVAVGRVAAGVLAIGQASFGLFALGQLGVGLLLGVGQASAGLTAIGQVAVGIYLGLGQLATGYIAIGQVGIGKYVLAQIGLGEHVWSQKYGDTEALRFFKSWAAQLGPWH